MRQRSRSSYVSPSTFELGSRYLDFTPPYGDGPWTYNGAYVFNSGGGDLLSSYEICDDELHKGPPWRSGGPFKVTRFTTDQYVPKGHVDISTALWRYVGRHLPFKPPSSCLPNYFDGTEEDVELYHNSNHELASYGAAGWNKFRPTNSGADLAQFLAELKDAPRMFQTTASAFADSWRRSGGLKDRLGPKKVADNWLNTNFGWVPFISDLRKFYRTAANLDKRLNQLRRDNGQWVWRGGTVAKWETRELAYSQYTSTGLLPTLVTQLYASSPYGWSEVYHRHSSKVWFAGRFRYWLPYMGDLDWRYQAMQHVFGARITPSLLWELTPWSWLVDWCSNVGDVIANITSSAADNLCSKYAYVMRHTVDECVSTGLANYKAGPLTLSWTASLEKKQRMAASPFGFGLTDADFSARQWSILAALGISRLR